MSKGFKPTLAYHVLTPFYDRATELLGYGASFKRRALELAQIQEGKVPKLLKDAGFAVREVALRYKGVQFLLASK